MFAFHLDDGTSNERNGRQTLGELQLAGWRSKLLYFGVSVSKENDDIELRLGYLCTVRTG